MSEKNLSRLVFLKELEKIYGKPQSIEPEKPNSRRKLFNRKETEMIFQHFKDNLENGTQPKKQDIVPFLRNNNFQNVNWHDLLWKIKTKQTNIKKKEKNRQRLLKRKLLQEQPKVV